MKKSVHVTNAQDAAPSVARFRLRARDLAGIAMLAGDGTIAVANVAEDLHQRIALPLATKRGKTIGITGAVYKSVRTVAKLASTATSAVLKAVDQRVLPGKAGASSARDQWLSILNGVLGDHLAATANPLALQMQLIGDLAHARLAIFVHGLCLNEHHWGQAVVQAARTAGYTPVFLRYNSGLPIADNGLAFSQLLAQGISRATTDIAIIVHSMGGLVTRSALAQGAGQWRQHVKKVVFLGTPHGGAPLERTGAWVHRHWQAIPYAGAFAAIANLRSAGITDLRFGQVLGRDANTLQTPPLPRTVKCFALAGALTRTAQPLTDQTLGDGLVGIDSALGQGESMARPLKFSLARRAVLRGFGHMELLHAPEVAAQLEQWLEA
jgi:pimeloyl-ACP methyl ester carboxylesterase